VATKHYYHEIENPSPKRNKLCTIHPWEADYHLLQKNMGTAKLVWHAHDEDRQKGRTGWIMTKAKCN
jgi:hypothetical protein